MGLFKNKSIEARKLQKYDDKIKVIYNSGLPMLSDNMVCEVAIVGSRIIINPLSGVENTIQLNVQQVVSVSVVPWGEFAIKYQHTIVHTQKNSPGRMYLVLNYKTSKGEEIAISFWGSLQLNELQRIANKISQQLNPKTYIL